MKRTIERIASLTVTAILLVLLLAWFSAGGVLAVTDGCAGAFDAMNRQLLRNWMMDAGRWPWLANVWMFGLFVVVAALGLNLAACLWQKMGTVFRQGRPAAARLMLVLHLAFGLLILLHLGSFMLGYRQEKIRLRPGQWVSLPDGDRIRLDHVHFVDDPAVLALSFRELSRDNYSFDENYAKVSLFRDNGPFLSGRIGTLRPLRRGGVQVTLKKIKPAGGKGRGKNAGMGAVVTVTNNPCLPWVLAFFPLLIISTGAYLVLTWRGATARYFTSNTHWRKP